MDLPDEPDVPPEYRLLIARKRKSMNCDLCGYFKGINQKHYLIKAKDVETMTYFTILDYYTRRELVICRGHYDELSPRYDITKKGKARELRLKPKINVKPAAFVAKPIRTKAAIHKH